jgi:hypothetical protein
LSTLQHLLNPGLVCCGLLLLLLLPLQNVALPDPMGSLPAAANRRRLLSGSEDDHSKHFAGSRAVIPHRVGGQAAAVAILGPLAANVTGDSGYYTGGGGLYVSLSGTVRLEECAFLLNTAYNGGKWVGVVRGGGGCETFDHTPGEGACGI